MRIERTGDVWTAFSIYEERTILKAAGWWWHPGAGKCDRSGCRACKSGVGAQWWTPDRVTAARLASYAAEDVRADLEGVKASQEASKALDSDIDIPRPAGLEYLPFQKAGIAYALKHPGVLLADEMGLGKSVESLGVINADPTIKRVLVICPSTLRVNWAREAKKWLVRPMRIRAIEGRELPDDKDEFIVTNYEKLIGRRGDAFFNWVMARQWDMLVVDEAHYLKTPNAKRSKLVLGKKATPKQRKAGEVDEPGLIKNCRRRLLLTGTPILNRPIEIFGLLNVLAPDAFPAFFPFAKRYCGAYQGKYGWDFSGATNLPELQEKMRASCMVRRLKKDVLRDLPPIRRQIIPLSISGNTVMRDAAEEELRIWKESEEEINTAQAEADLAHAAGDEASYKEAVKRLRKAYGIAFSAMAKARHDLAVSKINPVIEHLDGVLEELDKLIVFAHHHDVIDELEKHYGSSCVVITGDTPQEARPGLVDRFQTDPSCKVFIGSITAAGVGITLTAASTVIMAELDWVPANVSQAEARAHRIGQEGNVLVQHLVVDGSLDAKMAQMIIEKQEVMDKALDLPFERDLPALGGAPRPSKYPPATDEQKAAALEGLQILAGVCDGAIERDNVGYNGCDSKIGKSLAARRTLTDGQFWLARRILPKYHGQIGEELLKEMGYELKEKKDA